MKQCFQFVEGILLILLFSIWGEYGYDADEHSIQILNICIIAIGLILYPSLQVMETIQDATRNIQKFSEAMFPNNEIFRIWITPELSGIFQIFIFNIYTYREAKFKTSLRVSFSLDFRNFIFASTRSEN